MKVFGFGFSLFLVIILAFLLSAGSNTFLRTADISFLSVNATNGDGFSIITFVNISPGTIIRFTDSEWNGNHFGIDENDVSWNTGGGMIKAGSVIKFENVDFAPSASYGTINGKLKISKKSEAIFAYLGSSRMPVKFLAAVANDSSAYGTLANTGLVDGVSALTFSF